MKINTNIAAMQANRSLGISNNKALKSNQKLSSGYRINSAADDAAGMAVASKMRTQVRGLKMASRNSLDGISLIQTAEGALGEVQDMLQRIRELSIQSANDTLDSNDREAIQKEVDQLLDEIKATTNLTEFNKIKLLNGDIDRRSFTDLNQVAKCLNVSDTVQPGAYQFVVAEKGYSAILAGDAVSLPKTGATEAQGLFGRFSINDEDIKIEETDTAEEIFEKIRDLGERVGVRVTYEATSNSSSFLTAKSLKFETMESGSDQFISISADNSDLMKALGIKNLDDPIRGTDAVVKIVVSDGGDAGSAIATGVNVPPGEDIKGKITVNGVVVDIDIEANDDRTAVTQKLNNAFAAVDLDVEAGVNSSGQLTFSSTVKGAHVEMTLEGDIAGSTAIANALNLANSSSIDRIESTSAKPASLELSVSNLTEKLTKDSVDALKGKSFTLTVNGTSSVITIDKDLAVNTNKDSAEAIKEAIEKAGFVGIGVVVTDGKFTLTTAAAGENESISVGAVPKQTVYDKLNPVVDSANSSWVFGGTNSPNFTPSGAGVDGNLNATWNAGDVNSALDITIGGETKTIVLNFQDGTSKKGVVDVINTALETAFGTASPIKAGIDTATGEIKLALDVNKTDATSFKVEARAVTADVANVGLELLSGYSTNCAVSSSIATNIAAQNITVRLDNGTTKTINIGPIANATQDSVATAIVTKLNEAFGAGTFRLNNSGTAGLIDFDTAPAGVTRFIIMGAEAYGIDTPDGSGTSHTLDDAVWDGNGNSRTWKSTTTTSLMLDNGGTPKEIILHIPKGSTNSQVADIINKTLLGAGISDQYKAEVNSSTGEVSIKSTTTPPTGFVVGNGTAVSPIISSTNDPADIGILAAAIGAYDASHTAILPNPTTAIIASEEVIVRLEDGTTKTVTLPTIIDGTAAADAADQIVIALNNAFGSGTFLNTSGAITATGGTTFTIVGGTAHGFAVASTATAAATHTLDSTVWNAGPPVEWKDTTTTSIALFDGTDFTDITLHIPEGSSLQKVEDIINSAFAAAGVSNKYQAAENGSTVEIKSLPAGTGPTFSFFPGSTTPVNSAITLGITAPAVANLSTVLEGITFSDPAGDPYDPSTPADNTDSARVTTQEFKGTITVDGIDVTLELNAGLTRQEVVDAINSALRTANITTEVASAAIDEQGRIYLGSTIPDAIVTVDDPASPVVNLGITGSATGVNAAATQDARVELDLTAFLLYPTVTTGKVNISLTDSYGNTAVHELKIDLPDSNDVNDIKTAMETALRNANLIGEIGVNFDGNNMILTSASAKTISIDGAIDDTVLLQLGLRDETVYGTGGISSFSDTATVNCKGNRVYITDANYQQMIVDIPLSEEEQAANKNVYSIVPPENDNDLYLGNLVPPAEQNTMRSELVTLTVLDAGPLQLQVGPNENMRLEIQVPELSMAALGIEFMNLRTVKGATESITLCDNAINFISRLRSKLGAYQNRLEHTIANLDTTAINTTEALSRIQDTDMAEEMSKFTQQNVITQAGISMLSQANQLPQQLMKLLQ